MADQQGQLTQLITSVGSGLTTIADIMGQVQGLPEGMAQRMGGVVQEYQAIVSELSGEAPDKAPMSGNATVEAGTAKAAPAGAMTR